MKRNFMYIALVLVAACAIAAPNGCLNSPPEIQAAGPFSVCATDEIRFELNAIDPDGDALTWTCENLPDGATLDASTGEFAWIPDTANPGTYLLVVQVTDGEAEDEAAITVIVTQPDYLLLATGEPGVLLRYNPCSDTWTDLDAPDGAYTRVRYHAPDFAVLSRSEEPALVWDGEGYRELSITSDAVDLLPDGRGMAPAGAGRIYVSFAAETFQEIVVTEPMECSYPTWDHCGFVGTDVACSTAGGCGAFATFQAIRYYPQVGDARLHEIACTAGDGCGSVGVWAATNYYIDIDAIDLPVDSADWSPTIGYFTKPRMGYGIVYVTVVGLGSYDFGPDYYNVYVLDVDDGGDATYARLSTGDLNRHVWGGEAEYLSIPALPSGGTLGPMEFQDADGWVAGDSTDGPFFLRWNGANLTLASAPDIGWDYRITDLSLLPLP